MITSMFTTHLTSPLAIAGSGAACASEIADTLIAHWPPLFALLAVLFLFYISAVNRKVRRNVDANNAQALQNQAEMLRLLRELVTVAKTNTLLKASSEPINPAPEPKKEESQP